ncbi:MAG: tRNA uracil 4-sulfurtransferase ThiI [Patescibacteria group bacterium]|nr:tRNA uracil 4-sulfurtransferase ThiI [Patescibacteria group bacterium]
MSHIHIIIHYDEITLKGKNRPFFERALMNNIEELLKRIKHRKVYKELGKFIIDIDEQIYNPSQSSAERLRQGESKTETQKIKEILKNIPGISNFTLAVSCEKDIEKIKEKTVEFVKSSQFSIEKRGECRTFKIEARRGDKKFKLKSPEINCKVGGCVLENTDLQVDVHNPDLEIVVDVGNKNCFIYAERIKGIGGLPTGTAGKLVSLISGGIDSPVASFMMMRRGAKIVFIHFKNKTVSSSAGDQKIEKLVKILSRFQGKSKLYVVPFEEFQKEIIAKIPAKNRMIIYRRMMFKLSEIIAKKENAKGFVTGDSLSQVASQTIDNINAIYKAANLPIFPPLIGINKQETINLAKQINTYETSIIPYQDCCSFLIAKHPETRAKLDEIIKQDKNLEIDEITEKIMSKIRPLAIR